MLSRCLRESRDRFRDAPHDREVALQLCLGSSTARRHAKMKRSQIVFIAAFILWAFVAGEIYSYIAWIPRFKARFAFDQKRSLALGTVLYVGWTVANPLIVLIVGALSRCCDDDPERQPLMLPAAARQRVPRLVYHVISFVGLSLTCAGFAVAAFLSRDESPVASSDIAFVLLMASFAMIAVGSSFCFWVTYTLFTSCVVDSPAALRAVTGAAYASFAVGGVVATQIVNDAAADWTKLRTFFTASSVLQAVASVGMMLVHHCFLVDRAGSDTTAVAQDNAAAGEASAAVAQDNAAVGEASEPVLEAATAPRTNWSIIHEYFASVNGLLVASSSLLKAAVGPTITVQSGLLLNSILHASAHAHEQSHIGLILLNVAQTAGRVVVSLSGCVQCGIGESRVTVGVAIASNAAFVVASIVGATSLTVTSVYAIMVVGGFGYGLMWAIDAPLLIVAAREPGDWNAIIGPISVLVALGSFAGNYIAGALYDRLGHWTREGVECFGPACFKDSFTVLAVIAGVGTIVLAVLMRRV